MINTDEIDFINSNEEDKIDNKNESIIVSEELFKEAELEKSDLKIDTGNC